MLWQHAFPQMGDSKRGPFKLAWIFCCEEEEESLESCPLVLTLDHLERKK